MKQFNYFVFALLASVFVCTMQAQNKKTEAVFFDLTGAAMLNSKPAGDYDLTLYLNGEIIESFYVTKPRPINIELEVNKVYSLVYEKGNVPDKIVVINTEIPANHKFLQAQIFEYEVELAPGASTQKREMIDYPVAFIFYNKEERKLVFSSKYHQDVHETDFNPLDQITLDKNNINQFSKK